jgi:hypothetical protein
MVFLKSTDSRRFVLQGYKKKKHKAIRQKQYIKQEKVWSRLDTFLEVCVLVVIKKKLQQGEEE